MNTYDGTGGMLVRRSPVWWIVLLPFLLAAALCLSSVPQPAYAASSISFKVSGKINYAESNKCLKKVNKLRAKKGLKPLVLDKKLTKAAEKRAAEISIVFSHTRPNGAKCTSTSKRFRSENIYCDGWGDASSAYDGWRYSPPHYENMIKARWKSAGICCFERFGVYYWVLAFGDAKAAKVKKAGTKTKSFKVKLAKKYLKKPALRIEQEYVNAHSSDSLHVEFSPSIAKDTYGMRCWGVLPNSLFTFASSNPNILSVDKAGAYNAKGEGVATVTAVLKAKRSCKFKRKVEVL